MTSVTASLAFLLDMASRVVADGRTIDAVMTNENDAALLIINDKPEFFFEAQAVELPETGPVLATSSKGEKVVLDLFVERRMTALNIRE